MKSNNDWKEYKSLILDFKKKTEDRLEKIDDKLEKLLVSSTVSKVKLGIIYIGTATIVSSVVAAAIAKAF